MIDVNKPSEGIDYNIIGVDGDSDAAEKGWAVIIISGPYRGMWVMYKDLICDGVASRISYSYMYAQTEDDLPNVPENTPPDFDEFVFQVVQDIIRNGIANGDVVLYDQNTNN